MEIATYEISTIYDKHDISVVLLYRPSQYDIGFIPYSKYFCSMLQLIDTYYKKQHASLTYKEMLN